MVKDLLTNIISQFGSFCYEYCALKKLKTRQGKGLEANHQSCSVSAHKCDPKNQIDLINQY